MMRWQRGSVECMKPKADNVIWFVQPFTGKLRFCITRGTVQLFKMLYTNVMQSVYFKAVNNTEGTPPGCYRLRMFAGCCSD